MRIDAYNQITQLYKTNSTMKTQKTAQVSKRDKVEISDFGKLFQTTKAAVNNASDIREDKVNDLKSRINNGTYEVSVDSFADKLLANYKG